MMWTDPLFLLSAIGCVGAVICAAHSPLKGRWQAVSLASLLLVNFVLFQLAYTDWSPKWALEKAGIETTSVHLWAVADTICGAAAILTAARFWWGRALWVVAVAQVLIHAGMDVNLYPAALYTDVLLQAALLVQLAIFFSMGGRGIVDHVHRYADRLRLSGRRPFPVSSTRARR